MLLKKEKDLKKQKELNMIQRLHSFSGFRQDQIKKLFKDLTFQMVRDYRMGNSSYFPFLGEVSINYDGDENTDKGLKAKVELEFDLSEEFIRSIGQIIDGEESSDIENDMMQRIKSSLQEKL